MEFQWDEAKRAANLAKHGFDFLRAVDVFLGPHLLIPAHNAATEQRWLAIGTTNGVPVTVVFTPRGQAIRIISIRSARRGERRKHQALFD